MTANRGGARGAGRGAGAVLKSPLAAHSRGAAAGRVPLLAGTAAQGKRAQLSARAVTLQDFADYLRTTNNRMGRPYEEATVFNYVYAGKALDEWMTANGIEGDFTACDTVMLNRFLRDYFREHGQGGTHSQQRNMRHLFTYLQREFSHPHPYTGSLHQYQEPKGRRPATLSGDFIQDLPQVTGSGRARDFANARDHAMIRVLTEGVRRSELLGMAMTALPEDLIRNPAVRVVPLKGARGRGGAADLVHAVYRAGAGDLPARAPGAPAGRFGLGVAGARAVQQDRAAQDAGAAGR